MLFTSTLAAALATSALAKPTTSKREEANQLAVKITGPDASVDSVDGLKFKAAITNNGNEAVKVLKYATILDSLPTRSFTVTKDGTDVPFKGLKLNVRLNNDNAFTTIDAGKTVTVEHDVASLFDFAAAGAGKFAFKPITNFQLSGQPDIKASALASTPEAIEIEIKNVEAAQAIKRAKAECTDSTKLKFIEDSYTEGKELAKIVGDYTGDLLKDYFSTNSASKVKSVFSAVAGESGSRLLSCEDEANACDGNVIAYTIIATTDIYYCDIFFDEVPQTQLCGGTTPATRNIRGGTTLHELTHALSDTDDIQYGCAADKQLSASEQVINADNYNCLATEVYAATQC